MTSNLCLWWIIIDNVLLLVISFEIPLTWLAIVQKSSDLSSNGEGRSSTVNRLSFNKYAEQYFVCKTNNHRNPPPPHIYPEQIKSKKLQIVSSINLMQINAIYSPRRHLLWVAGKKILPRFCCLFNKRGIYIIWFFCVSRLFTHSPIYVTIPLNIVASWCQFVCH